MSMARFSKRLFCEFVYFVFVSSFLLWLAATLQVGSAGIYLFIVNDIATDPQRIIFMLGFPTAYLTSLVTVQYILRLPKFDFFNRIIAINIIVYSFLGLALSTLRLPLVSREVFLSEFLVSSVLLIIYYKLLNRYFPLRIGVLVHSPFEPFDRYPALNAVQIDAAAIEPNHFDGIVTNLRNESDPETTNLFARLAQQRIPVYDTDNLIERLWARIPLDNLTSIEIETFRPPTFYLGIKRLIELILIITALPLIVIICILIAIAIKLDSPGPIIFRQQRIGFSGETFVMLKFRSMLTSGNHETRFAEKKDNRITRVGKTLRRVRLDELPQLWNVLRGDMSLIGPRPEQPQFTHRFSELIPFYGFRHTIRPGITGWSQVMYGYAASDDQTRAKLEFDFYYIKHMSAWLDLVVLVKTVRTIILGSGAR